MPHTFLLVLDVSLDEAGQVHVLNMHDFFKTKVRGLDSLLAQQGRASFYDTYRTHLRLQYPRAIHIEGKADGSLCLHDIASREEVSCRVPTSPLWLEKCLYSRLELGTTRRFATPIVATFEAFTLAPRLQIPFATLQTQQLQTFDILNYPRGVLANACADKAILYQFAAGMELCPPSILIDLYQPQLDAIGQFLNHHQTSHYVFKSTTPALGRGIEVFKNDEILEALRQRQQNVPRENPFLLLQVCRPSKKIMHDGANYTPTGKIIIEATFSDNPVILPTLNYHTAYWVFPNEVAQEELTLASLNAQETQDTPAILITGADLDRIKNQLQQHLPTLLSRLYTTDFANLHLSFMNTLAQRLYQTQLQISPASRERHGKFITEQWPQLLSLTRCFEELEARNPHFTTAGIIFKRALSSPTFGLAHRFFPDEAAAAGARPEPNPAISCRLL